MNGVIEPVIVRKNGEKIEVVAGRGRTKAAVEANKRLTAEGKQPILIPVMVRGGSDADIFGVMISENEIRRGDTMLVKGAKARKLLNMGYDTKRIAVTFGVTRQAVESWLAADELPPELKNAIGSGAVSATAAIQNSGRSRDEQVDRIEEMSLQGKKVTVAIMRGEKEAQNAHSAPKLKLRKEIERKYMAYKNKSDDFAKGYREALMWVLGK
jgi:ParB family chromosome partitioning protein